MEASAAGLASGDAASGDADGQGQGQGEGQNDAQQTPDVTTQLNSLGQLMEQQRQQLSQQDEFLRSQPWAPQDDQQDDQQDAPPDFGFLDDTQPGFTPEGAAKQLGELIDSLADKKASERVDPVMERVQAMEIERATDALITEFPQLNDDAVAEKVIDTARRWAESRNQPELAKDPELWRLVYLAGRAVDQSGQEDQPDNAATLEGGGGASPAGARQGDSPTTDSVTSSWRSSRLPMFAGGR